MITPAPSSAASGHPPPLAGSDLAVLRSAAAYQARRIARTMRVPTHAIEDIEQDILLAVLKRRRYFDPGRGPWVPFVHRVSVQAAQQVADEIAAERRLSGGSLDEPTGEDGVSRADRLVDPTPLADPVVQLIARRVIDELPPRLQAIALAAIEAEGDYGEAGRAMGLAPASFHRGLAEVRLRLRCHGIRPTSKSLDLPAAYQESSAIGDFGGKIDPPRSLPS